MQKIIAQKESDDAAVKELVDRRDYINGRNLSVDFENWKVQKANQRNG